MKRFTLIFVATLMALFTWAQNPLARSASPLRSELKTQMLEKSATQNAGPLAANALQMPVQQAKAKAPRRAEAEVVTPPEGEVVYYKYSGTAVVNQQATSINRTVKVIFDGNDVYVQGMTYYVTDAWVKGTIDGETATFATGQYLGDGLGVDLYYVGSDGDALTDVEADYAAETGNFTINSYIFDNAYADDWGYYAYVAPSATLEKIEGDVDLPVEVPDGLETAEYNVTGMSYDFDTNDELVSQPVSFNVKAGFVMTSATSIDIYVQGLCSYLPEAWVKGTGTMDGSSIKATLPSGQFFGTYDNSYDMYFVGLTTPDAEAEVVDVVFDFDIASTTLTLAEGTYVAVNGAKDEADWYTLWSDLVITPVEDKAAMPADPEITKLTETDYGYAVEYVVPTCSTDGEGLISDKLYFTLYTETDGEVEELTFTPATHKKLTEDMTEVPVNFRDNYDFEDGYLYLNDLYSEDWNKIGIQSIYYGGDERNATEIQWLVLKTTPEGETTTATFDFNAMDVATSSNDGTDGDILEAVSFEEEDVTLTISPKDEEASTQNRFWATSNGPQLRVYSGTLTFEVPEGATISEIVFNYNSNKWGADNAADSGEITNDADAKTATWAGEAQTVVVSIAANTQINSIDVTYTMEGGETPDPEGYNFGFDDGTLQGWTLIDADGDGNNWKVSTSINTYGGSEGCVYSESYSNTTKEALTPDNYLVSPKLKLDGSIVFYACAQDASYPEEHFGVFVSTLGNTDGNEFKPVDEWTMTATRTKAPANARGMFRAPNKTPGAWYRYEVDLSGFGGEEGYVAIRHFNCTDNFYIVVDNITLVTSWLEQPDYVITPAEGVVESLQSFEIKFNIDGVVVTADAQAKLTNSDESVILTTSVLNMEDNTLSFEFMEELTDADEYTLTVTGIETAAGEALDLEFTYVIEAAPELVELPEGVETEVWSIEGTWTTNGGEALKVTTEMAFDGTDVYLKGLPQYFEDAWIKGTLYEDEGYIVFPSGQFVGEDESGYEFICGLDETGELTDIVFAYDEAREMLYQVTPYILENSEADEFSPFAYITQGLLYPGELKTFEGAELPEGVETAAYNFTAMELTDAEEEEEYDGVRGRKAQRTSNVKSKVAKVEDGDEFNMESYSFQIQVGFDGKDVYFQGFTDDISDFWVKGTMSEDGTTVTIPANQYLGTYDVGGYGMWTYDYYLAAVDEDNNIEDVVLTYDADANTFSTDQMLVLHDKWYTLGTPYQSFLAVDITMVEEIAATPADPSITSMKIADATYPYICLDIPTIDTDGNDLVVAKLFYTVWYEKNGTVQQFVVTADEYSKVEEDMTEVPYVYDDAYDIYRGGERFYINPTDEAATWTKIGVQSIYYGGGECNKSNIVWSDELNYDGIVSISANGNNAVIYDMQGRRVANPVKGLFIMNGKKVLVK